MVLAFHEGFETGSVDDMDYMKKLSWLTRIKWRTLGIIKMRLHAYRMVCHAKAARQDICKYKKGVWYRWNYSINRWFKI